MRARLKRIIEPARSVSNGLYDIGRFVRHSNIAERNQSTAELCAAITFYYHKIEKGLALPRPRPLFGAPAVARLLDLVRSAQSRDVCHSVRNTAISALDEYSKFAALTEFGDPALTNLVDALHELQARESRDSSSASTGGTMLMNREDVLSTSKIDLWPFLKSRHSVRHFTEDPVDPRDIEQAVEMAIQSPSVCNRQGWKVHVLADRSSILASLNLQNGNRGFDHEIGTLLVVTSDMSSLITSGERYQGWIDSGMYSMSLIYALHSLGLGTCPLNWSAPWRTDRFLRSTLRLPESESVVMMIAVGELPEEFRVACSPRKPLDDVLVVHDSDGPM